LATGEYTSRRELYQFEKISHRDYMHIYALFLYIEMYLAMFTSTSPDYTIGKLFPRDKAIMCLNIASHSGYKRKT
jgi:hypothetical protein